MNGEYGQLPLPMVVALATLGAGGGGASEWALLAARGLAHPRVQQAARAMAEGAVFAGAHAATGMQTSSVAYMLAVTTVTAILGIALLVACACGGGLASAAAWSLARPQEPTSHADLHELATQVAAGGQEAQYAMARRLEIRPALVAERAAAWARVSEGPRSFGRRGPRQQANSASSTAVWLRQRPAGQ